MSVIMCVIVIVNGQSKPTESKYQRPVGLLDIIFFLSRHGNSTILEATTPAAANTSAGVISVSTIEESSSVN